MQPCGTQPPTVNTCKALWLLRLPELAAFMFLQKTDNAAIPPPLSFQETDQQSQLNMQVF